MLLVSTQAKSGFLELLKHIETVGGSIKQNTSNWIRPSHVESVSFHWPFCWQCTDLLSYPSLNLCSSSQLTVTWVWTNVSSLDMCEFGTAKSGQVISKETETANHYLVPYFKCYIWHAWFFYNNDINKKNILILPLIIMD